MFWFGLGCGVLVGLGAMLFALALCQAAKDGAELMARALNARDPERVVVPEVDPY